MDRPLDKYTYRPKTDCRNNPIKHKWDNPWPGVEHGKDGHPEGMCPSTITLEVATEILRDGIPHSPEGWSKSHPKWVYNIYRGAVYKAVETVPGVSYHGFPCPGPTTHPRKPDMTKAIKEKLLERAGQRGCRAEIEATSVMAFDLRIEWSSAAPAGTAFEATEGHVTLTVNDREVWAKVHWHWVDLLAFLAENWVFLKMEQTYPSGLKPKMPHLLRYEATGRWELEKRSGAISDGKIEDEEEYVFNFEYRHDLSCALEGKWLPSVFIFREGNHILISGDGFFARESYGIVISLLEKVGDEIAARLKTVTDDVARLRLSEWAEREKRPFSLSLASLVTGVPVTFLDEISGPKGAGVDLNDNKPEIQETVFMAAARMAHGASLSPRSAAAILSVVAKSSKCLFPALLSLQAEAQDKLRTLSLETKAADQGRSLAEWARKKILKSRLEKKTPELEAIFSQWKVPVHNLGLSNDGVDAILCWGGGHGPVVITNSSSTRNRRHSGLRAALAHELCHLLFDLDNVLPFADVISGNSDDWIEKRAKAFAAEFLFPRSVCERLFRDAPIGHFINEQSSEYDVSSEIVAWQLFRSSIGEKLTNDQKKELQKFVSNPGALE